MKVKQLLMLLQNADPESNVVICYQPNWPLEANVANVMPRRDTLDEDEEEEDFKPSDGSSLDDTVIVMGSHLRYGNRRAFQ